VGLPRQHHLVWSGTTSGSSSASVDHRAGHAGAPLRIALVAETFLPSVNGVSGSVVRACDHLRRQGHELLIIAPGPGPEQHDGVPVVRIPSVELPSYPDLHVGRPTRMVTAALRDFGPDVVHVAGPVVLGLVALRAARRQGIPTVAIYQTDLAGFAERYGLGRCSPAVWRWITWVHRHADITLAPSSSATWDLRQRGVHRVARWMRGVDTEAFHPRHRSDDLRRSLAPAGSTIVGYVGRLAREKQVERLRPLLDIDGVHLVVVGDGPVRAELERVLDGATFTGFLRGPELGRHVASLDVFVHPGLDETFCQSVQEAMAASVPVVVGAAGGPLDLVQHGVSGYLWSPLAPVSLAGAVEELARSPVRREQMGHEAHRSVQGRTWEIVMRELEGHLRAAVNGLSFAYAGVHQ
jgi:phosphatidylinositol alpha 1,6-mannosyltransferase